MRSRRITCHSLIAVAGLSALAALTSAIIPQSSLHAQASQIVIATGLNNPRGLTFGPDGFLYVVEAGNGGTSSLCLPIGGAPGTRCYGPSGSVTRITGAGVQERIVTGLPSLAPPSGEEATGPHDIDFGLNRFWVTVGLAANPAVRAPFEAAGIRFGSLVRVLPTGAWDYVADLSAHEAAVNPDGGLIDSNPYGIDVLSDRAFIADAGANAVIRINLDTSINTVAVFPNTIVPSPFGGTIPMQAVPTTVTFGPGGNLFVGQLTGFPFPAGAANIFQVPGAGGSPTVVASGFTNIIDFALASNLTAFVLEHDANGLFAPGDAGRLVRVNPNGTQSVITTSLVRPGGIAIGPDGALYITNRSVSNGTGEVVRIVP
jgi:hypothetical protein